MKPELVHGELFAAASAGVALLRAGGGYASVNAAYARIFGYESPAAFLEQAPASPPDGETRVRRRDGALRWVAASRVPLGGAEGLVQLIVSDVTEEREARATRVEREAALLRLEHQVTLRFAETQGAAEALRAAMRDVCESQGWEAARYLHVDEARNVLRASVAWSIDEPNIVRYIEDSRGREYAPGYGLAGTVWQANQPLWVPDITLDPRTARPGIAAKTGMHACVLLPVHAEGRTVGVLIFDSREVRKPDERLMRALQVIGGQIGLLMRRAQAEEALRRSEAEFRTLAENAPDGILRLDAELRITFANPVLLKSAGRTLESVVGRTLLEVDMPEEVRALWLAAVRKVLETGQTQTAEFEFESAQGLRDYHARFAPERRAEGTVESVLVISRDVTRRKRYERHIEHLANHDGLTGLPNRTLLRDRVEQAIMHTRRAGGLVALMFVDLDHFKLVNDSFGHVVGDALLMECGKRLKDAMRDGDTVARLGGDEFVLLLPDLPRPGDAAVVARKIEAALEQPVLHEGRELRASASIGIALYPGDGDDLDTLLQCADAAMYRAKDAGRNGYQYYSAEMGSQARARVDTESGLRNALERGELRLHYQPQVDLRSGRIAGFEALLRWEQPGRGMVSPAQFVPVAEETGLIVPIGQWALREACREAAGWRAAGLGDMKVSVNLSARQFWRGGVTEAVRAALAESGLPAAQLELEVTESVVARDLEQVTRSLEQLRRVGVGVAIDDFGTGYSSLSYLRSLPIQKLKIDKSFIDGIPDDAQATALVAEIVRLAHVLSLESVAEGVETQDQVAALRQAGCEAMQGYAFSRPLPARECAALLRSGRRLELKSLET